MRPVVNLLRLTGLPIRYQLALEEALLRATQQNWIIINDGAFQPAIVMGISGRAEEMLHVQRAKEAHMQVLKRFTGGGTVVVDSNTIFATLIFQSSSLPHIECFPQPIMRWTEYFYKHVFHDRPDFAMRENDYVFGQVKFGGNAQAITGRRWLHHTSLLWDYDPAHMALLKNPSRAPKYRQARTHADFLVPLKDAMHCPRDQLVQRITHAAHSALPGFQVQEQSLSEASRAMAQNKQWGTKMVDLDQVLRDKPEH
ncbi:lipoate protein ligase-like protein [Dunaliella salina]|uniref:Lipoate protein ligase-like protein n=1 Tax=Dunaliella salina TaxID=3046 RepID=A0ABQ7GDG5_DUNSA|nr:lipoate protein ligase-like protein [Dunaliella salina]|eukprot:KAF5832658.1 lipoate protein ligase-like protein [Dunaliella salina]